MNSKHIAAHAITTTVQWRETQHDGLITIEELQKRSTEQGTEVFVRYYVAAFTGDSGTYTATKTVAQMRHDLDNYRQNLRKSMTKKWCVVAAICAGLAVLFNNTPDIGLVGYAMILLFNGLFVGWVSHRLTFHIWA